MLSLHLTFRRRSPCDDGHLCSSKVSIPGGIHTLAAGLVNREEHLCHGPGLVGVGSESIRLKRGGLETLLLACLAHLQAAVFLLSS